MKRTLNYSILNKNIGISWNPFTRMKNARAGWQKLCGARGAPAKKFGLGRKFYARTYAILSRIKICRNLRTFWRSLGKKSAFLGQKQCFLGKKCTITWYILHILLSWICKFAITRKNDAFVAKIVNTRLTKIFMAIFAPNERLPSPATLGQADCKKGGAGSTLTVILTIKYPIFLTNSLTYAIANMMFYL